MADKMFATAVAAGCLSGVSAVHVRGFMQVPRPSFYTASMSGVVGSQLGQFGHKPEILGELLAGM